MYNEYRHLIPDKIINMQTYGDAYLKIIDNHRFISVIFSLISYPRASTITILINKKE